MDQGGTSSGPMTGRPLIPSRAQGETNGLLSPTLSSKGGEGEAARIVREMAMRIGTSDKSGFPVVVPGCAHVCWGGVQFNCRTSSPDLINTPLQRGVVRVRWLETVSTVSWLAWSERAIE